MLEVGTLCRVIDNSNTGVPIGAIGKVVMEDEVDWEEGQIIILEFNEGRVFKQGLFRNQLEVIKEKI